MTIIRLFAFRIGNIEATKIASNEDNNTQKKTSNITQNKPVNKRTIEQSVQADLNVVMESNTNEGHSTYAVSDITANNWEQVFLQLPLKGTAKELARNAHIISNQQNEMVIAIDKQAHAFMTENAQNKLKNAIEKLTNEHISVKFTTDINAKQTIAKVEQKLQKQTIKETHQKVEQNPFIKQMQNDFDAKVIQIKQGESFLEVKNER